MKRRRVEKRYLAGHQQPEIAGSSPAPAISLGEKIQTCLEALDEVAVMVIKAIEKYPSANRSIIGKPDFDEATQQDMNRYLTNRPCRRRNTR